MRLMQKTQSMMGDIGGMHNPYAMLGESGMESMYVYKYVIELLLICIFNRFKSKRSRPDMSRMGMGGGMYPPPGMNNSNRGNSNRNTHMMNAMFRK